MKQVLFLFGCALLLALLLNGYTLFTGQGTNRFFLHAAIQISTIFSLLCLVDLLMQSAMGFGRKLILGLLVLFIPLFGSSHYYLTVHRTRQHQPL